jgi:hypothetical protein
MTGLAWFISPAGIPTSIDDGSLWMISRSSVGVGAACDGDDRDLVPLLIDAIDHPVGATPSAVTVLQRRLEAFADALWVSPQWAYDERVGRKRDRLGETLGKLAARGG